MASIRKHGTGWQAQVRKQGHAAVVKTFRKKTDAEAWARQTEIAIERGEYAATKQTHTSPPLSDLLFRYLEQCTATKRGAVSEAYRIKTMLKHPMSRLSVKQLKASTIAAYRDERLEAVSPSSVRRELVILRHCLEVARREWGVALADNPVRQIQMPSESNARERRVSNDEIAALNKALNQTRNKWVAPVVRFALATGMRRGEILRLTWGNVDLDARTARIPLTKNGRPRTIPLSGPWGEHYIRHRIPGREHIHTSALSHWCHSEALVGRTNGIPNCLQDLPLSASHQVASWWYFGYRQRRD